MRRVVHRRGLALDVPDSARLPAGIDDPEGDATFFKGRASEQTARPGADDTDGFGAGAHCDILIRPIIRCTRETRLRRVWRAGHERADSGLFGVVEYRHHHGR